MRVQEPRSGFPFLTRELGNHKRGEAGTLNVRIMQNEHFDAAGLPTLATLQVG
jgi:hypothetical protein